MFLIPPHWLWFVVTEGSESGDISAATRKKKSRISLDRA
jgi:hypothetical protein